MAASALGFGSIGSFDASASAGSSSGPLVSAESADAIARARASGGNPLPAGLRSSMESGFGHDFSGVRVHTDEQAHALSTSLRARAFTVGQDIFFNSGQYAPAARPGKQLLAHELAHTLQQEQGHESVQRSLWDDAKSLWDSTKPVRDRAQRAWYEAKCSLGRLEYPDPEGTWRDDPWMCKIRTMAANPYILAAGAKGPSVRVVHQYLRKWICDHADMIPGKVALPVGDVYNSTSIKAVKTFQRMSNELYGMKLQADGKVGFITLGVMDRDIGGPKTMPPDCSGTEPVDCQQNFIVNQNRPTITLANDVVNDDNPHLPQYQAYTMEADADVEVVGVGTKAANEWDIGYHQVVLSDSRVSTYQFGSELQTWGGLPMRDDYEDGRNTPPFSAPHVRGKLQPQSVGIADTPNRKIESPRKEGGGGLRRASLDIKLADWLIARKRTDPVNAEPCYLQNFDWGVKWEFERLPRPHDKGFANKLVSKSCSIGTPTPGKGSHTPDLSTNIAGRDASPTRIWVPDPWR